MMIGRSPADFDTLRRGPARQALELCEGGTGGRLDIASCKLHRRRWRVAAGEGEDRGADAKHVRMLGCNSRLDRLRDGPENAVREQNAEERSDQGRRHLLA